MKYIILLALFLTSQSVEALTPTEIKVCVKDQDGLPVSDASVKISFDRPDVDHPKDVFVTTDTNGFAMATDSALTRTHVLVTKEGYYKTSIWEKDYDFGDEKWDATHHLMLKEKRNPVPMFVRKINMEVPNAEMPVGFDLEKADWVAPFGTGVFSDFLISVEGEFLDARNRHAKGTINFSGLDDGILLHTVEVDEDKRSVGSEYIWPHLAPEEGYERIVHTETVLSTNRLKRIFPGDDESKNYIFRIRTKRDEKTGELICARYGKIKNEFRVLNDENVFSICFTYYLNPNTNDRNLEFNPEMNLFLYKKGRFIQPWRYPSNHPIHEEIGERWRGEFGPFGP